MMQRQQKIVKRIEPKILQTLQIKKMVRTFEKMRSKTEVWIIINFWGTT